MQSRMPEFLYVLWVPDENGNEVFYRDPNQSPTESVVHAKIFDQETLKDVYKVACAMWRIKWQVARFGTSEMEAIEADPFY